MWSSIRGRGNNNSHSTHSRGPPPTRQATLGNFTSLNGNGQNGTNGRVLGKTELNFNNKDNNSNIASTPPMYFKGSGPVSLNGANGQSDYVVGENNIPMRPLTLSPGNGSSRNLPSYGVATRGGGSYLLQPPGKVQCDELLKIDNKLTGHSIYIVDNLMVVTPNERLIRSTPGSPTALLMAGGVHQQQQQTMDGQPGSFEVIGSAENLVGRVSG